MIWNTKKWSEILENDENKLPAQPEFSSSSSVALTSESPSEKNWPINHKNLLCSMYKCYP